MEAQLSTFFAEHNIAFLAADHLVKLLKKRAKDSQIIQDMTLGRKKCGAAARNVIANGDRRVGGHTSDNVFFCTY